MTGGNVFDINVPNAPDLCGIGSRSNAGEIVRLENRHIAAYSLSPVEKPTRRCILFSWDNYFEELIAQGKHTIGQSKDPDTGVYKPFTEVQDVSQAGNVILFIRRENKLSDARKGHDQSADVVVSLTIFHSPSNFRNTSVNRPDG